jgi:hypothetical protein
LGDRRKRRRRLQAVLKRFWNVAGALIGVGSIPSVQKILGLIWRRVANIDTAADLWIKAGGTMPRLLTYIESPFFGPALIFLGFLWAFVRWRAEDKPAAAPTITIADRIGWTLVAGAIVAIFGAILFDEFLIEANAPQFARSVIDQQSDRGMDKSDFEKLVATFSPVAKQLPSLQVEAVSASPSAAGYAVIFMAAFHASGMTVNGINPNDDTSPLFPSSAAVASAQMKGLFIGVKNASEPPKSAIFFKELLETAGFKSKFATWTGISGDTFVFVVSCK